MTNKKLTNRQAIGVLDGLWSNPLFGEAHRQAFEIGIKAIKAIEQEPVCDRLAREYISKIKCCDECFLSTFCTINDLRESREPKYYCIENIKKYFESKSEGKE